MTETQNLSPLEPMDFKAVETEPAPIKWLLENWVGKGVATAVYEKDTEKSRRIPLEVATALTITEDSHRWQGVSTYLNAYKVMAILCRHDANELASQQRDICQHIRIRDEKMRLSDLPDDRHRVFPRRGKDNRLTEISGEGSLVRTKFWHQVHTAVQEMQPDVVIFDQFSDICGGNQHDNDFVKYFMELAIKPITDTGAGVLIVENYDGEADRNNALLSQVRSVIYKGGWLYTTNAEDSDAFKGIL